MATIQALSLKTLLVPSKSVQIEYPGLPGFKIDVSFLSRETLMSIRKKASKTVYKNRVATEELDDALFLQLYVQACIKNWSGLKLQYLEQLAPVDLGSADLNDDLGFTEENALFLMKSSTNFDAFISETVTDLANFQKSKESK